MNRNPFSLRTRIIANIVFYTIVACYLAIFLYTVKDYTMNIPTWLFFLMMPFAVIGLFAVVSAVIGLFSDENE